MPVPGGSLQNKASTLVSARLLEGSSKVESGNVESSPQNKGYGTTLPRTTVPPSGPSHPPPTQEASLELTYKLPRTLMSPPYEDAPSGNSRQLHSREASIGFGSALPRALVPPSGPYYPPPTLKRSKNV